MAVPLRPNERWSMDFMYDTLADGRIRGGGQCEERRDRTHDGGEHAVEPCFTTGVRRACVRPRPRVGNLPGARAGSQQPCRDLRWGRITPGAGGAWHRCSLPWLLR